MLSYKNIWEERFILTPLFQWWPLVATLYFMQTHICMYVHYYNNLLVFLLKGILVCIFKNLILYSFTLNGSSCSSYSFQQWVVKDSLAGLYHDLFNQCSMSRNLIVYTLCFFVSMCLWWWFLKVEISPFPPWTLDSLQKFAKLGHLNLWIHQCIWKAAFVVEG